MQKIEVRMQKVHRRFQIEDFIFAAWAGRLAMFNLKS